jgi:hypothetical protein
LAEAALMYVAVPAFGSTLIDDSTTVIEENTGPCDCSCVCNQTVTTTSRTPVSTTTSGAGSATTATDEAAAAAITTDLEVSDEVSETSPEIGTETLIEEVSSTKSEADPFYKSTTFWGNVVAIAALIVAWRLVGKTMGG